MKTVFDVLVGLEPTTLPLTEVREAKSYLRDSVIRNAPSQYRRGFEAYLSLSFDATDYY
jgi:hypothetical protein